MNPLLCFVKKHDQFRVKQVTWGNSSCYYSQQLVSFLGFRFWLTIHDTSGFNWDGFNDFHSAKDYIQNYKNGYRTTYFYEDRNGSYTTEDF